MAEWLNLFANVLMVASFLLATTFVVTYATFFNPRKTTGGWFIWRMMLAAALFGAMAIIGIMFPDWSWRPGMRVLGYLFVTYSFAQLVILLFVRRFRPDRLRTSESAPYEQTLDPRRTKVHRSR